MNVFKNLLRKIGRAPVKQVQALTDDLSDGDFKDLIVALATRRANALPPTQAIKFLMELDTALYPLHGAKSIEYGGGLHSKHRHIRYHDFFVDRVSKGDRVLDIGCGNGALSYDVADRAVATVTAIDLHEDNIAIARDRYAHPGVRYLCGDALSDIPAEIFDVVVMSNVLEHLPAREKFLQQIQRAIKPSRFLIRVPLFERDWRVPLKKELGLEWRSDLTHETEYTLESFAEEIAGAGLEIVHQEVRWGEIWAEVTERRKRNSSPRDMT